MFVLVQPSLDLDRLTQSWSQFTPTDQLLVGLNPLVVSM